MLLRLLAIGRGLDPALLPVRRVRPESARPMLHTVRAALLRRANIGVTTLLDVGTVEVCVAQVILRIAWAELHVALCHRVFFVP